MTAPIEIPDLPKHLWELVAQVPPGYVTTYGDLAEALGNPVAVRWIGHFLLHHEHDDACPCHRVVRGDGQVGLYTGGTTTDKANRLAAEGVAFEGPTVELGRCRWEALSADRPLEQLKRSQEELAKRISLRGTRRIPALVGGVDVSYPSEDQGIGAYALIDWAARRLVWSVTVQRRVRFPYISGYLAFRELPVYLDLLNEVRAAGRLADVVLVDGTGILHPRRAGIASALGVALDLPTIGVAKKLLCGRVDWRELEPFESRPVTDGEEAIGVAIRSTATSGRAIFVSPGHRITMASAEAVVRRVLWGRRLPEPLYYADRLSRAAGISESGNC